MELTTLRNFLKRNHYILQKPNDIEVALREDDSKNSNDLVADLTAKYKKQKEAATAGDLISAWLTKRDNSFSLRVGGDRQKLDILLQYGAVTDQEIAADQEKAVFFSRLDKAQAELTKNWIEANRRAGQSNLTPTQIQKIESAATELNEWVANHNGQLPRNYTAAHFENPDPERAAEAKIKNRIGYYYATAEQAAGDPVLAHFLAKLDLTARHLVEEAAARRSNIAHAAGIRTSKWMSENNNAFPMPKVIEGQRDNEIIRHYQAIFRYFLLGKENPENADFVEFKRALRLSRSVFTTRLADYEPSTVRTPAQRAESVNKWFRANDMKYPRIVFYANGRKVPAINQTPEQHAERSAAQLLYTYTCTTENLAINSVKGRFTAALDPEIRALAQQALARRANKAHFAGADVSAWMTAHGDSPPPLKGTEISGTIAFYTRKARSNLPQDIEKYKKFMAALTENQRRAVEERYGKFDFADDSDPSSEKN